MPDLYEPTTAEELREAMAGAGASRRAVELFGGNSKRLMAGQITEAELRITTAKMRQILQYEPRDLTISVEAGVPLAQLNAELAKNGQMIPLDGPYGEDATIGGVVAANINGPRRKVCGTARDLIIGMKFATLDGKLVDSGGMVVKNVAGLDMGKLMIGSFGTLAAIASVNFKLLPRPAAARTMIFAFDDLRPAMEVRDAALRGQLNPAAVEMVNPLLSPQLGLRGYALAILFAGTEAVIERSVRDASAWGSGRLLTVEEEPRFWSSLQQITPRFLEKFREGAVVRVSTTIADCGEALGSLEGPGHAHAASGIVRGWFTRPEAAARWLSAATGRGWKGLVEFTSESARPGLTLWPEPGPDFAIMKEVKRLFDPEGLLNRGRLYGRI